ncbi:MAG: hypothetical protein ACTHQM_07500 [Thermoanaerobaculia bacterium]
MLLRLRLLLLLRFLLLRRSALGATRTAATTTSATTPAAAFALRLLLRCVWLLRGLLLLLRALLLALLFTLLLLLLLTLFLLLLLLLIALLFLPLLLALLVASLLLLAALLLTFFLLLTLFVFRSGRLSSALLELTDLLVHVAARLVVLLRTHLVVTAVRTAFPPLGIGLFAGGAENTFGQWHRRIGAHCTLRAVDESRRRTLLALVHLAEGDSPSACWDDVRAIELLRSQATPEELRELGTDERLIEHVFPETHVG